MAGSLQAIRSFTSLGEAGNSSLAKKNVVSMLEEVSERLGNTRTVCKKYYIHPGLITLYEENKLFHCINGNLKKTKELSSEECALMSVWKKFI